MKRVCSMLAFCLLLTSPLSYAAIIPKAQAVGLNQRAVVKLQVIEGSVVLNKHNVAHAAMQRDQAGKAVVNVVLSDQGAKEMNVLVSHNLGKTAMITLGQQIITVSKLKSALGDSFQLTGFTLQQAQAFVNSVHPTTQQTKG